MAAAKCILFLVNIIFVLAGAAISTAAILVYTNVASGLLDIEEYVVLNPDVKLFLIASMVLGAIVFFIAFLGCCGAVRDNKCMLTSYSAILIVLAILKTALLVYVYLNREKIYVTILNVFKEKSEGKFHEMEIRLDCCGVDADTYTFTTLPQSCCEGVPFCTIGNKPTCSTKIQSMLSHYEMMIFLFAILIVVVELLAATLACCLGHQSRKGNYYH